MDVSFKKNDLDKEFLGTLSLAYLHLKPVWDQKSFVVTTEKKTWLGFKKKETTLKEAYSNFFDYYSYEGGEYYYKDESYKCLARFDLADPNHTITMSIIEWNELQYIYKWYKSFPKGSELK